MPIPIPIEEGAPAVQIGFHLGGHRPEIERDAVDDGIGFQNLFMNLKHVIPDYAYPRLITLRAIETP